MIPKTSARRAFEDPNLLGRALPGPSFRKWRIILIAMMGEPLFPDEMITFKELTGGRDYVPGMRVEEAAMVCGRRAGKSRAIAALVAYVCGLCDHPELVLGERGMALIIAADQEQALTCLNYVEAAFSGSPMLKQLIASKTAKQIRLTNNILVQVRAADYRRVRGVTLLLAVADEIAFFVQNSESANADTEICAALRPALATTLGILCLCSSPYAKKGELYNIWRRNFGPVGDPLVLVVQAATRVLNPTLPRSIVDRAIERDPIAASAEYGAEFRSDVSNFVDREIVLANIMPNIKEILPAPGVTYQAWVDPSGGSVDSYTMAIGHGRGDVVVIDCLREVPAPFSPEVCTAELAQVLKSYRVTKVVGDRYAGDWPREAFRRHGIDYQLADAPKSAIYTSALPLLNSCRLEMPDNPRLISQLCGLERRTSRGGRDSIDHAPNSHDDLANSALGLATLIFSFNAVGYPLETWKLANGSIPSGDTAALARERAFRIKRGEVTPGQGVDAPGVVKLSDFGYHVPNFAERAETARKEMMARRAAEQAHKSILETFEKIERDPIERARQGLDNPRFKVK